MLSHCLTLAARLPERERQQQQERGEEARQQPRVEERDRRLEDALVGAGQVDQDGD